MRVEPVAINCENTDHLPFPFFFVPSFTSAPASAPLFLDSFPFEPAVAAAVDSDVTTLGAASSGNAANLTTPSGVVAFTMKQTCPYPHDMSVVVSPTKESMNFGPTDDLAPPSNPNFPYSCK